jgi:hypothetical protein
MDADEKRRTYAAARAIKDHFFAVAKPILFDGEPDRGVGNMVNPFYDRTQSGLFVEVYYGAAPEIWTPWGRWNFRTKGTSGTSREYAAVMDAFLARVKTTVHEAQKTTRIGEHGPVYAVVSVDGCDPLPPAIVAARDQFDDGRYEELSAEWKALAAAYDAAHGIVAATSEVARG